MPQYRKKPVVIDAVRFTGIIEDDTQFDTVEVPSDDWVNDAIQSGKIIIRPVFRETRLQVQTTEGNMIADTGDWIIRGVEGEIYPCKPSVFEATYEEA